MFNKWLVRPQTVPNGPKRFQQPTTSSSFSFLLSPGSAGPALGLAIDDHSRKFPSFCKQLIHWLPEKMLPASPEGCPLGELLQTSDFDALAHAKIWTFFPVGPQRDACEVLESMLDPTGPMHIGCDPARCYGVLLRALTLFPIEHIPRCKNCASAGSEMQSQWILRCEPHVNADASIARAL